ncbi:hypothetical protein Dsin_029855 [Dipteronia sinensis]|uniref:Uncharacterized protein n=1 Tax=Dipteronia sinensis TaxID=43782 RepID=A0AAD9ZTJ8_9ROSI|nr:hypothetical protein Dsin_029855 [Dipteronia sinensis]
MNPFFVRAVHSLLKADSLLGVMIEDGFGVVLGKRDRLDFWNDIKWDSRTLKAAFLRVYALAVKKSGSIQEFGCWSSSEWVWDVQTRRNLFYWEKDQWRSFQTFLSHIIIHNPTSDALAWKFNSSGVFTVSSFRQGLEKKLDGSLPIQNVLWKGI